MKKIKILIAHNNKNNIEELKAEMEKMDFVEVVGEASNGIDAYIKIKLLNPEVVFTKYNMEYMTGKKLVEIIEKKKINSVSLVKFISDDLSAYKNRNSYQDKKNKNIVTTVRELGKEEIVNVLNKYYKEKEDALTKTSSFLVIKTLESTCKCYQLGFLLDRSPL